MIYLSAGSIWEIVIKESKGRLDLPLPSASYVPTACSKMGATFLPIRAEHAFIVRDLPPHHKDPFDRIIVAQALIEGLTLVTADAKLLNYPVTTLDAR